MKVPRSVRDRYEAQLGKYKALHKRVDRLIKNSLPPRWHYESRIKDLESFALKIETGRFQDLDQIEDFFACTIVVEKNASLLNAEKLCLSHFNLIKRRPKSIRITSKSPDCFRFDDTRLYVSWRDDTRSRPSGLDGVLFEIQIKTYLAFAWSIATHDMIYKTDTISWAKERIAFQIKAILEHVETSIEEAEKLSKSKSLMKTNNETIRISKIISLVNDLWPPARLPKNRKRLAENINNLIRTVDIDIDSLRKVIEKENGEGRGTHTLNLSPYSTIVQSLFNQRATKMRQFLTGRERNFKLFIPKEIEIPEAIASSHLKNAIL